MAGSGFRGREDAVVEACLVEEVVAVALQREDCALGLHTVVPSQDWLDDSHVVSLCHCWHVDDYFSLFIKELRIVSNSLFFSSSFLFCSESSLTASTRRAVTLP